jgi:hypothetical protein
MVKRAPLFSSQPEEQPSPRTVDEPKTTKRGKHLISGMFDKVVYRQYTTLAAELGLQRQQLLREALNDLFAKHGKPPIA